MICLTNFEGNVKLEFDFLNNLPADFDRTDSKFEKWVPYVFALSTPQRTVAITTEMEAFLTVYEVEKIYNGLKNLLDHLQQDTGNVFKHYSNESFFETKFLSR